MIKIDVSQSKANTIYALEYTEVHEAFHGFGNLLSATHAEMAAAAYSVGKAQGLFSGLKRIRPLIGSSRAIGLANSDRFNRMLFAACPPRH